MNREIEFRAKSNGRWVHGDLHLNSKIPHIHAEGESHPINVDTIGQFTGLTDRNGKKIYEGDIVKEVRSEWLGQIDWRKNGGFFYILEPWYSNFGVEPYSVVPLGELDFFHHLEVIGNIYDNPEIIKNFKL